ncbi:MAG: plasmid pRiA4b ORF-3 family protein [Thermogutta sp.]|nr:plasmid pRiA4b ORF-3 family protein [Thermogutta sp.]
MTPAKSKKPQRIIIFKVALSDQKDIWRRIAISAEQTLDDLHEAIFQAFDREEEHLYSFYFPQPGKKGRAALRDAVEYSHPFMLDEPTSFDEEVPRNAAETRLSKLDLKPRQTFKYLFDFGDSWWHDITVQAIDAAPEPGRYPRVLERHGESPPQYPDPDEEGDDEEEDEEEEEE